MITPEKIVQHFVLYGETLEVSPYGSGHINDTYAVVLNQGGRNVRYILQRINDNIFKEPSALMENIQRACQHVHGKLKAQGLPDASRRVLTLIPARSGHSFYCDDEGHYWRMYIFVENATGHDVIASTSQAYEAARAFGEFQGLLTDLPGKRLHETIPDFHNTPKRFSDFISILDADTHNRAAQAKPEIDWVLDHAGLATALADLCSSGRIPERPVTHNDTKLNNVLLDNQTGKAVCVIDLDTLMPGLAGYDFGDLVRTSTSPAAEDEQDLSRVTVQIDMFEALAHGYLSATRSVLNADEVNSLPLAGQVITFECGVRFLTDFISGDTYFKIRRPSHNLDRCRAQFKMVDCMERQMDAMMDAVKAHL